MQIMSYIFITLSYKPESKSKQVSKYLLENCDPKIE